MEWEAGSYKPKPEWPGGSSGVTIGYGYDLGQNTKEQFRRDWGNRLDPKMFKALEEVVGLKGGRAKTALDQVSQVRISQDTGKEVLLKETLPRFVRETIEAYPGAENLSPDALGALVSMTFNRGSAMTSSDPKTHDRYAEKRMIRSAIENGDLKDVPFLIEQSKRLWEGKKLGGLLERRDGEAELFRQGLKKTEASKEQSEKIKFFKKPKY